MTEIKSSTRELNNMLNQHRVTLKNLSDLEQNFKNYLDMNSSMIYENCSNLTVRFDSKINRLTIKNCDTMTIILNGLITGLEIKNSQNITIINQIKQPVNSIFVDKCNNISIKISKQVLKNTVYGIEKSVNINFRDHKNNKINRN